MSWLIVFVSYFVPLVLLVILLVTDRRYRPSRLRPAAVQTTARGRRN